MLRWTNATPKARKHFRWEAKKGRYTLVITQRLHDEPHYRPTQHHDEDGKLVVDWDDMTEIPVEVLNRFHLGIVVEPDAATTLQWTYDHQQDLLTLNPDSEAYVGFKTLQEAQEAAEKLPAKLGPIMAARTRKLGAMTPYNSVRVKAQSWEALRHLRLQLQRRIARDWLSGSWRDQYGVWLLTEEEWSGLRDRSGLYRYKTKLPPPASSST